MAGEKTTRLILSDLRSSGTARLDVALDSFQVSKNVNDAIAANETFVHFKEHDGGGVAVKVDRILHISEVTPD